MHRDERETLIEDIEKYRKIIFRANKSIEQKPYHQDLINSRGTIYQVIKALEQALKNDITGFELTPDQRNDIAQTELLLKSIAVSTPIPSSSTSRFSDYSSSSEINYHPTNKQIEEIKTKINILRDKIYAARDALDISKRGDDLHTILSDEEYALRVEYIDIGTLNEFEQFYYLQPWEVEYLTWRITYTEDLIQHAILFLPAEEAQEFLIETEIEIEGNAEQAPNSYFGQTIMRALTTLWNMITTPAIHPQAEENIIQEETLTTYIDPLVHLKTIELNPNVDTAHAAAMVGGCGGWFN